MTKSKEPHVFTRHEPLYTPLGKAHFDAPGQNGTFFVYHSCKDFTPEEWTRRFGPNAGNLVFRFYLAERCIHVDPYTGKPAEPLPFIDDSLVPVEGFAPIPRPVVTKVKVGEIWYTRRGGDPYIVISSNSKGITLAYIHDRSYIRTKANATLLERFYTKEKPHDD